MKEIRYNYPSAYDFIEDVRLEGNKSHPNASNESHTGSFSFCQSKDWEDSVEQLYTGIEMEQVDLIRKHTMESITHMEEGLRMDVQGDYVDIGVYLSGEPECMVDFQDIEVDAKDVHIAINVCESGGVAGSFLAKKAAVIAAAVDKMEHEATHRVKISVCMINRGLPEASGSRVTEIVVKDYGQPMNVAEVSGALAVGFFRRIMFSWIEKYAPKATHKGYGYVGQWAGVKDINEALQITAHEAQNLLLIENSRAHDGFNDKLHSATTPEQITECANILISKVGEVMEKKNG